MTQKTMTLEQYNELKKEIDELKATNDELKKTNDELKAANNELKEANNKLKKKLCDDDETLMLEYKDTIINICSKSDVSEFCHKFYCNNIDEMENYFNFVEFRDNFKREKRILDCRLAILSGEYEKKVEILENKLEILNYLDENIIHDTWLKLFLDSGIWGPKN